MKIVQRGLLTAVLLACLVVWPPGLNAQAPGQENSEQIIMLLKEQNSKLSGELRRIQREIAALRADLDKPGLKEVFSGIGYILGLFGVAAFVAARRKE